ncbi:helix-turn-helix transcriptional regulator [Aeromicrobium wangtongii]|uniref:Helix-turn-helix domain-containing protein n=1 Tax=Aeromicrobium wangtongii TaxID=2969247 RepID=A0ABY5MBZ3_9ACTN|nr:helix-turn-helix domain-containing protein [Aeromicrobium wangtongii]MCD9197480.1 helix-turn-helix domain-containing protein [Aeromicrobium wangtongii]UUP14972.1 helix-turn-helix domain-containing protein [Aeromicrobium wangtongii]
MTNPANELLTTDEAAQEMRSNVNTLAFWRATNRGPAWAKLGRRVVYRRGDIEAFIAGQFKAAR